MGILDRVVSRAVSDGIRKGVGNAIGKAVEQAVAPAAQRWADKQATAIDNAADKMNKNIQETSTAANEAGKATTQAASSLGGLAGLESTLTGLAAKAETYAAKMTSTMKICPNCGQPSQADKAFCPNCGTKLPETTLGQDYTCAKCGTANTPGTKFCTNCGALLPGAEAEMKNKKEKDEKELEKLYNLVPQFPKWEAGGCNFEVGQNGENCGYPVYTLQFDGGKKELDAYVAQLLQAGFIKQYDDCWKVVDGVCRVLNMTDAINNEEKYVYISFYVDPKFAKKPDPKPAAQDPISDLKGIFKKYF